MKTKDWDRAERQMLDSFDPGSPVARRKLLSSAVDAFLADCGARHLKTPTVTSYQATLGCGPQEVSAAAGRFLPGSGGRQLGENYPLKDLEGVRATRSPSEKSISP